MDILTYKTIRFFFTYITFYIFFYGTMTVEMHRLFIFNLTKLEILRTCMT